MKDKIKVYVIGGVAILLLVVLFYLFNRVQTLSNSKNTILGTTTNVTTQPTPTIKPAYVDSDPIIECKFTYIGTMKLRRSVCNRSTECQIGGKWVYYDSVDKCKTDQANAQPKLVSCVLSYGTFNLTESSCSDYKAKDSYRPSNNTYTTTPVTVVFTPAPTVKSAPIKTNQEYRTECINNIKGNYDFLITKYQSMGEEYKSWVGSLTRDRDNAIGNCMAKYPTYLDN